MLRYLGQGKFGYKNLQNVYEKKKYIKYSKYNTHYI